MGKSGSPSTVSAGGAGRSAGDPPAPGGGGHRHLEGGRLCRSQRPGDCRARRLQPGPDLLPLRVGGQPSPGRPRRRELREAGALRRVHRPGRFAARACGCCHRHIQRRSRRRLRHRPGRDDRGRLVDAWSRPRGRGAHQALDRLRPAGHRRCAGRLTTRIGAALPRCGVRHRRALPRTRDAQPPRR